MTYKSKYVVLLLSMSLVIIGSMSVMGLLQSSERVNTSGIIVHPAPSPPLPPPPPSAPSSPPPEPSIEIDVFEDVDCTQTLTSVDWGSIEVGLSVIRTVYIKNAGDYGVTLSLNTENWSPGNAIDYIHLTWDYNGSTIDPGQSFQIRLTLSVDSDISDIDSFDFDIVFIGLAQ